MWKYYIYLFQSSSDDSVFKIGITSNINRRVREIESKSKGRLKFFRAWEVGRTNASVAERSILAHYALGNYANGQSEMVSLRGERLSKVIKHLDNVRDKWKENKNEVPVSQEKYKETFERDSNSTASATNVPSDSAEIEDELARMRINLEISPPPPPPTMDENRGRYQGLGLGKERGLIPREW